MSTITVTINITKADVYEEVRKMAAYKGARGEGNAENYDRISLTEAQSEALDRFWAVSIGTINDILKPYLTTDSTNADVYKVTLAMPSNWNSAIRDDLANTIQNYYVHGIASMWFRITDQPEQPWAEDAASFIAQIKRKFYDRVRPTKPSRIVTEPTSSSSSTSGTNTGSTGSTGSTSTPQTTESNEN